MKENPLTLRLILLGGKANVVGGVFVALAYLLHPSHADPETVGSSFWIWVHVGFMVSLVAGIFALFAFLLAYLREGGGRRGVMGCTFAVISLIFVFGLDYAEVFVFPTLAHYYPDVVFEYGDGTLLPSVAFVFPLTGLLFFLGYELFSWELKKRDCISGASALMLMIGTFIFSLGLSGLFPMYVVRIGSVLFGAGLVWTGLSLIRNLSAIQNK